MKKNKYEITTNAVRESMPLRMFIFCGFVFFLGRGGGNWCFIMNEYPYYAICTNWNGGFGKLCYMNQQSSFKRIGIAFAQLMQVSTWRIDIELNHNTKSYKITNSQRTELYRKNYSKPFCIPEIAFHRIQLGQMNNCVPRSWRTFIEWYPHVEKFILKPFPNW